MELTQQYVQTIFEYREDGNLIWKQNRKRCKIGDIAGCISEFRKKDRREKRRVIVVDGNNYFASRLIFLFHTGMWPEVVDHKDRDSLNDRIENLRAATKSENCRNVSSCKNSSSRYLGVYKRGNKWRAGIGVNGKKINIGTFNTEEEGAFAYNEMAKKYFGEFANLNQIL